MKVKVQDDIERLTKHVYPIVGTVPLRSFTRADADRVMHSLSPALSESTARQVAQLVQFVLKKAHFAEEIDTVPLPPGWLPKVAEAGGAAKECMRPSEEAAFLKAKGARFMVRFAHGIAVREGSRCGNLVELRWRNITFRKEANGETKGEIDLERTKTGRGYGWVLSPAVARALEIWKKVCPARSSTTSCCLASRGDTQNSSGVSSSV